MAFKALTSVLILFALVRCEGQGPDIVDSREAVPLLMAILSRTKTSGSLEYSGSACDSIRSFPKLHVPLRITDPPLQALREIFSEDPKMEIAQESDGTIRMAESDVPRDLLDVTISHISFTREPGRSVPLYDPTEAMWAILRTAEVRQFKLANNIGSPAEAVSLPHAPFTPESPHIGGSLDNVTLSQALDYVHKTFPGLWVYENCPATEKSRRMVLFSFFSDGPGWIARAEAERRGRIR